MCKSQLRNTKKYEKARQYDSSKVCKSYLLENNSCTEGYIVTFTYVPHNSLLTKPKPTEMVEMPGKEFKSPS
jgi:hypothetical protein